MVGALLKRLTEYKSEEEAEEEETARLGENYHLASESDDQISKKRSSASSDMNRQHRQHSPIESPPYQPHEDASFSNISPQMPEERSKPRSRFFDFFRRKKKGEKTSKDDKSKGKENNEKKKKKKSKS